MSTCLKREKGKGRRKKEGEREGGEREVLLFLKMLIFLDYARSSEQHNERLLFLIS